MGISRIEQAEKNNFGYYVRLTRSGQQHAKFFSDLKNGGKRKALKAAQQYFEDLFESMPQLPRRGQKTVRNSSGRVGVSRTRSASRGHMYEYWQASWSEGEERRSVKFSVSKYGEEKAKRLAVKVRRDWEKEAAKS